MTYLTFVLFPLLSQLAKAHDPRNRLCDLIALPLSPDCSALPECKAILSSSCQDDTCACSYATKAEACVNCMASDDSVNKYNDYLGACVSLNQAAPTTVHTVSPSSSAMTLPQSSPVNGQFTDIKAAMGVETQVVESADLEYPVGTASVVVNSASPVAISPSVYRGIEGQTQAQAQPGAATKLSAPPIGSGAATALPVPLNAAALNAPLDPHGINVINDTTASPQNPSLNNISTTALNSTHNFFSQAISQACVQHCVKWKTQADVSTARHRMRLS